jgi:YesN/AraC family two-component response regulator
MRAVPLETITVIGNAPLPLLERREEIGVIGEAADAATALELFTSLDPRVVVMDVTLPVTGGLEAMQAC